MKLPTMRKFLAAMLVLTGLAAPPAIAQTVTNSLADDFTYTTNLANNTNSPWSFRLDDWTTSPPAFLPLLNSTNYDANQLWGTDFTNPPPMWSIGTNYWAIGKNATGVEEYSAITGTTWAPGEVLFWPNGAPTPPARLVIGWTSAYNGVMDVNYTFGRASDFGNGIGYTLLYRSGGVDTDLIGFTYIGVNWVNSHTGLAVKKGDQLFFRFDAWGNSGTDITRADIDIIVTPDIFTSSPVISSQPTGGTGYVGFDFTLSVTSTNAESYQWRKDGNPIVGATSASYTIEDLEANDAGVYTVVLTNPLGSVTSDDAMLDVVQLAVQSNYSLADDFSITTNPGSNTWSYGFDGVPGEPVQFLVATNNTLNANDLWATDFANPPTLWSRQDTGFGGIGKNTSGVVQSSSSGITWNPNEVLLRPKEGAFPARLVIRWTAPADLAVNVAYTFERALAAGGVGYSMIKRTSGGTNTVLLNWTGPTSVGALSNSINNLILSAGDDLFWRIDSWGPTVEDDITKAAISITPLEYQAPPVIITQPAGATAFEEFSYTFSVLATDPQSYQWRKDGNPIVGATAASYTIENLSASDAGVYSVLVTNILGSVVSDDAMLDVVPGTVVSTYSLADNFSITTNGGSNAWSYGYDNNSTDPLQFIALTNNTLNANDLWATDFATPPAMWSSEATIYGGIGKNTSGVVQTSSSGITWNPDEVLLRPKATAPMPGRLVVAWTAPTNHTVKLVYTFERALAAGGVGYSLVKRTTVGDTYLVGWFGSTSAGALSNSLPVSVSTGDQLFWHVDSWGTAVEDDITKAAIDIQVIGAAPTAPILAYSVNPSGSPVTFTWDDTGGPFHLEAQTNALGVGLSTNWFSYPNGTNGVQVPINPADPAVFFRLSN